MGWAVIREVTDTRIRDAEDAARASGVRVLGAPSGVTNDLGALLLANGQLRLSTVEAYRRLSVNLQLLSSGRAPLTLVMTGPRGSEGTIITATDLAITFAERGDRVVLVDADLGQTRPGGLLGLPPVPGFRDVLAGSVPLAEALRVWRVGLPLLVLPNGTSPSGPFDMVREQDVATLRDELTDRADIVIFVAPPLLTKPDAVLLARVAGSALVVARTKATRSRELSESVGYLQSAGVEVLGVVLKGTAGRSNWAPNGLVSSGPDQAGDLTEDMAGSGPLSSRPAAA
jgi:Mrp family chromosome partitioning ATPase